MDKIYNIINILIYLSKNIIKFLNFEKILVNKKQKLSFKHTLSQLEQNSIQVHELHHLYREPILLVPILQLILQFPIKLYYYYIVYILYIYYQYIHLYFKIL